MSKFITNILKLVSGSVISQVIGISLIPIVTRLYSPEDYGIFQFFLSISSIIVIISCLSYEFAIVLPKEDKESINIVVLCSLLICIISIISGSFFLLFSNRIETFFSLPGLSQYLIYLPVVVFLNAFFVVSNYWLIRKVRFGTLATSKVINSFSGKIYQIGIGLSSPSPLGLILGLIFGYIMGLLALAKEFMINLSLLNEVNRNEIKTLAIRYKHFPLFASWSGLANSVSLQIAPLMLTMFFSPDIVGFYAIANTVVKMPMRLIGSAIGQAFFQKASQENKMSGKVEGVVKEVHQRLVSIGVFPILILIVLGKEIFSFVLGSQWSSAGEYARILAPWFFLVFITSPLSTLFNVLEKQKISLLFNLLILSSRIIVLYVGGLYGNPTIAILLYSITGVIFWGGMNLYILKISGIEYMKGIEDFVKYLFIGVTVISPLVAVRYFFQSNYILFSVAIITAVIYYSIVVYHDLLLKREVKRIIRKIVQ